MRSMLIIITVEEHGELYLDTTLQGGVSSQKPQKSQNKDISQKDNTRRRGYPTMAKRLQHITGMKNLAARGYREMFPRNSQQKASITGGYMECKHNGQ